MFFLFLDFENWLELIYYEWLENERLLDWIFLWSNGCLAKIYKRTWIGVKLIEEWIQPHSNEEQTYVIGYPFGKRAYYRFSLIKHVSHFD